MSTLILVRHGQAAAFEADSDRLTDLGWEQARRLGAYWAQRGMRFDTVVRGSLRRHRETAEAVAEAYRTQGVGFPEPLEVDGWNEYDGEGIVGTLIPQLAAEDASFRRLLQAFQQAEPGQHNRHFQRMFEVVVAGWRTGTLRAANVEPFSDFYARVQTALASALRGKGTVAVFTSGGPIGVCVQTIVGAPEHAGLELSWRVRNASLTEVLFSGERRSLDSFNGIPHLDEPGLLSFR